MQTFNLVVVQKLHQDSENCTTYFSFYVFRNTFHYLNEIKKKKKKVSDQAAVLFQAQIGRLTEYAYRLPLKSQLQDEEI